MNLTFKARNGLAQASKDAPNGVDLQIPEGLSFLACLFRSDAHIPHRSAQKGDWQDAGA